MSEVVLKDVAKIYEDGFKAVKNINMHIEDKEFVVFVGPSGCGKSTTLRMIAGLESISEGELFIGGDMVNNVPAKDRDIAMVFQSYALYPHMTVRENMAFPLKMRNVSKEDSKAIVDEVAQILQLDGIIDKKPGALSGGQRQRVALGRAMVRKPKVFLLDEPLSNLDAKLRVTMRSEIVDLHKRLETTFIYVTHDQTEAMTMGDRIAVLNAGILEQFDTPGNLYHNPANKFVAEFIGSPQMNMMVGNLLLEDGVPVVSIANEIFPLSEKNQERLLVKPEGQKIYVGIRPEAFEYVGEREDNRVIKVHANNVEQLGSETYIYFSFHSAADQREFSARLIPARPVPRNADIYLRINIEQMYLFDYESEQSILDRQSVTGIGSQGQAFKLQEAENKAASQAVE